MLMSGFDSFTSNKPAASPLLKVSVSSSPLPDWSPDCLKGWRLGLASGPKSLTHKLCHKKNTPQKHSHCISIIQVYELDLLHYLTMAQLQLLVSLLIQICHFTSHSAQGDRALLAGHTHTPTHKQYKKCPQAEICVHMHENTQTYSLCNHLSTHTQSPIAYNICRYCILNTYCILTAF